MAQTEFDLNDGKKRSEDDPAQEVDIEGSG
jgi:hypothetical protein